MTYTEGERVRDIRLCRVHHSFTLAEAKAVATLADEGDPGAQLLVASAYAREAKITRETKAKHARGDYRRPNLT